MPHNQTIRFKSRLLFGRTFYSRDIIEIDEVFITLRRRGVFNRIKGSINIPLNNIKNIGIKNTLTGANIFVESRANRSFTGRGFSAKAIEKISEAIEMFVLGIRKE